MNGGCENALKVLRAVLERAEAVGEKTE
jgi:hypothetical protein